MLMSILESFSKRVYIIFVFFIVYVNLFTTRNNVVSK